MLIEIYGNVVNNFKLFELSIGGFNETLEAAFGDTLKYTSATRVYKY